VNTSVDSKTSVTPKPMINISKHPRSNFAQPDLRYNYPSGRRLNRSATDDHTAGQRRLGAPRPNAAAVNLATVLTSRRALTGRRLPREWGG
jgi:hypothetical protein